MEQVRFLNNENKNNFFNHLVTSIKECKSFLFSVAFISDAAVQLLVDTLLEAQNRGVTGKILTTDYMMGTDPKALRRLMSFENIEIKVYQTLDRNVRGFHTKGYIFDNESNVEISIGSSNLTANALKYNHEWNMTYFSKENTSLIRRVTNEFEDLWNDENSVRLNEGYLFTYENAYYSDRYSKINQQQLFKQLAEFLKDHTDTDLISQIADNLDIDHSDVSELLDETIKIDDIKPNSMQEKALESLSNLRHVGAKKGLVIAATGTGKTYLAAFDALQLQPKRLLFIVHREKILKEAIKTFKNIMNVKTGLYTGNIKELDADYIFASIQTLSRDKNLYQLNENAFDYIVIDEAHRSAAPTYQKVMEYFKPKFILGLTATPERTDSNSIFELFDNQIAAEIRLRDALQEKLVVPFHYFGITDAVTDYEGIDVTKDIDEVAERLNIKARVDLIIENINKYSHSGKKTKALGFCINVKHAEYMANEFNQRGYISIALTGKSTEEERDLYIKYLEDDRNGLSFIFTVDIFNEGIDIPSLNLVLMLRPTQSPIIFTQQLGRGLRLHPQKEYLTVLDFIGNHNKAFLIPIALSGDRSYDKDDIMIDTQTDFMSIPGDTFIRLDEISKSRILHQLERYNFDEMKNLKELYNDIKRQVKRMPSLLDFGFDGFDPIRFVEKSKSYVEFVIKMENIDKLSSILKDEKDLAFFRFLDSLLPLKRVHEFIILDMLIKKLPTTIETISLEISKYVTSLNNADIEHALSHLKGQLFGDADLKRFSVPLSSNVSIELKQDFITLLNDKNVSNYLLDSIEYGIRRYQHEFGRQEYGYPAFKQYYQYQLRDVTQIARYNSIYVIQSGVSTFNKQYYLFVTLEKGDVRESINYKDKFIDRKTFQWESPSNTTQFSVTGSNLINHKDRDITIHLFVKKGGKNSDIYSKKMIYLGIVDVMSYKSEKPIQFILRLRHEVPEDIYYKLTTEFKSNEKND